MKRIVVLIDGTWNKEGAGADTNVAKLDPGNKSLPRPLIKARASNGIVQNVHYHIGVGSDGNWFAHYLGGTLGVGLKAIIQDAYDKLAADFEPGDEVYLFGFSRGAYAVRALAGMIGASGLQKRPDGSKSTFDVAWNHYRVDPKVRDGEKSASAGDRTTINNYSKLAQQDAFHADRAIKCVGVWDTVGSYGVPAGFGFESLQRYLTSHFLGFHDTHFGSHIDFGFHAVGIDEQRRPFVPTFWTSPNGHPPRGVVEQTWFAGVHANVGGSYTDCGLSDRALIWMIARVMASTGLECDADAVRAQLKPNLDGEIVDSTQGVYLLDHWLPYHRPVLATPSAESPINERVHWSALEKRGRACTICGVSDTNYNPVNLPAQIAPDKIATITAEEMQLISAPPISVAR